MSTAKETKSKGSLTYFEKQRDALISEIAISMESVLNNVNALNRSLEGAVAVGKEFDSVAALWSNFYDGLAQQQQLREQREAEMDTQEPQSQDTVVPDSQDQQAANDNEQQA